MSKETSVLTYFCFQIDTYVLAQYTLFEEFVSLVPVYMCRIRNRTLPFIAQKPAVLRVSQMYTISSNDKVNFGSFFVTVCTFNFNFCVFCIFYILKC